MEYLVGFNRETKIVDLIKEIDKILKIRIQ